MRKLQLTVNLRQSHRHSSLELWTCGRVGFCMSMPMKQGGCWRWHCSTGSLSHTHAHTHTHTLVSLDDSLPQAEGKSLFLFSRMVTCRPLKLVLHRAPSQWLLDLQVSHSIVDSEYARPPSHGVQEQTAVLQQMIQVSLFDNSRSSANSWATPPFRCAVLHVLHVLHAIITV